MMSTPNVAYALPPRPPTAAEKTPTLPNAPPAAPPKPMTLQSFLEPINNMVAGRGSAASGEPTVNRSNEQTSRSVLASIRLQQNERDDAFKERLMRFVVDKTKQIDEIELHLQDLSNKIEQAQQTLNTLQGAVRFLDQRYLESTNQQLQQLLADYLARLLA